MGIVFIVFVFTFTYVADKDAYVQKINANRAGSLNALDSFKTDFGKASISLSSLVHGGPGKDGIPSLSQPSFSRISDVTTQVEDRGLLVTSGDEVKFYPLNVMVWHEVVNDEIDGVPVVVSYSPLTGTAVAYDRSVGDAVLDFGVTGLLYEANQIMYDRKSESFWVQNSGVSVAGFYNGTSLKRRDVQILDFAMLKKLYPNALVLNTDTGYSRDYTRNPYEEYMSSDVLYPEFRISYIDNRNHPKDLVYAFPVGNVVFAIRENDVVKGKPLVFNEHGYELKVERKDSGLEAHVLGLDPDTDRPRYYKMPGYYEMWFSWSVARVDDGILLEIK